LHAIIATRAKDVFVQKGVSDAH